MKLVQPRSGEGWGQLLANPKYNGGDTYPPEVADTLDGLLDLMPPGMAMGLLADGTPSALFTLQQERPGEFTVHYAADGRIPLSAALDVMDAIMAQHPHALFLAFVRRLAVVRVLASRGWFLRSHEDDPFMALMCHVRFDTPAE